VHESELIDSCTLRANSHCRTRPGSIPAKARQPIRQSGRVGGQPVLAVQHVLQYVVGGHSFFSELMSGFAGVPERCSQPPRVEGTSHSPRRLPAGQQ